MSKEKPQYTDGQRVKLPASIIRTDRGTQSRDKTNPETIREYSALMREGVDFDPVTVFYTPDGEHVLSRGFHRLPAAIDAGRGDIDAIIRLGTLADAKWDSAGSNKHGLRCTPADYAQTVALALEADPTATDRKLAQHIGVSAPTVAKYRPVVNAFTTDQPKRRGKDGKEYPATKPKKPKADKPAEAPEKPVETPKSAAKPAVKVTYDRSTGGAGEESQDTPDDGLPTLIIEAPASPPDPVPPAAPRQETPLSEQPAIFAGRDEEPPKSFDLPKAKDRARATFLALFVEFPKKHWPVLREIFDEASTEVEG